MNLLELSEQGCFIEKRTFKNINFQITLPKVTLFDERIEFTFRYKVKPEIKDFKVMIGAVSLKNRFNEVQKFDEEKIILCNSKNVAISLDIQDIKSLTKLEVSFVFLCNNGQKSIAFYRFNKDQSVPEFIGIGRCCMTKEETEYFNKMTLQGEQEQISKRSDAYYKDSTAYMPSNIFLEDYVKAIRKETVYLKNNGGKRYKVSNGSRLTSGKEGYSYQFEMESELFLPEDAPLSINTSAEIHAEGSVLVCEEFQIIIIVNRDLGEKVFKADIGVEPWKLLVAQVDRIARINSEQHPIAVELIEKGPGFATKKSIHNIPKGQANVKKKVLKENITVVWGPPGTGKTYTMSEIAVDFIKQGKSVLIVSHSNVSVDGVVKKVANRLRENNDIQLLKNGTILRYGYVRDIELGKDEYASSFNYALNHCHDLKRQMEKLQNQKDDLKNKGLLTGQKLIEIEKKLGHVRSKIREQEKIYVAQARLVGTTISKVIVDGLFESKQYDLVMFDEVSMAYVTQIACAASFARKKFLCVGDFMQLPPIAQDRIAKNTLEKDIFEYLGITDNTENMYYHPWLVMLDTQRRMHPDISEFVNKHVYKRLLKNHEDTIINNQHIIEAKPLSKHALNMIDLHGTYATASKNADNSRFNILSAIISFASALSCESKEVNQIGIITPYAAQMRLVRAMIKDCKSKRQTNIVCSTVHQFQGSESDVIVFDAVESYPTSKAGFLMSKNLHSVKRLINVAITRTKGKLINVCNSKFWLKEFSNKKSHIYYQFVSYLENEHNVISCKEKRLQKYLEALETGPNINIYSRQEDCFDKIKKDFNSAESQIIISIPDGELKGDYSKIFELIQEADKRGVQILMKSNSYMQLPEKWKYYCIASENAVFPLIMIDGKTIWYGIPLSKGKFSIKDYGFITVCDTLIRIKGENTIEMIESLSELTMKRIGNSVTPLFSKKNQDNEKVKLGNFPEWISKKQFCPKCKHYLVLAKGKSGKYYLKCPEKNCDHTEFLTKEMINHYIKINNVTCPQDHGELEGKLGRYGVYITCSCGHSIKPDQI